MGKKDTMLEDFKELFSKIGTELKEHFAQKDLSVIMIILILIRYLALIVLCSIIIPITHILLFAFPFLERKSTEYDEESEENK